ncbi:MAG: hypothetical protein M1814_006893 [Vezdaea aestivalis]|nr:MAG: hypothetical protein M1814_006893 [Vezdaea aestivalis]
MPAQHYRDHDEPSGKASEADLSKPRKSLDSLSSASTTSLVFDRISDRVSKKIGLGRSRDARTDSEIPLNTEYQDKEDEFEVDVEDGEYGHALSKPIDRKVRRWLYIFGSIVVGAWVIGLIAYISSKAYRHSSTIPHDPAATASRGSGKQLSLDSVLGGDWRARVQAISWIEGADGEDGLLLERGVHGKDYLVVEDVRSRKKESKDNTHQSKTLMKLPFFTVNGASVSPSLVWPSKDLKHVLVMSEREKNWRHSYTGVYWIFDVKTQTGQALDPDNVGDRIQLASWSPQSDAIVFTRDNDMFLRRLSDKKVERITRDGGVNLFYGIPDWVYEEEVFSSNTATWWAEDGKFVAFLRTNDSAVPEYPIQYFVSRPSGDQPSPGEENYPEVRQIKYPKAGAPNPTVSLLFYDVEKKDRFSVDIPGDFTDSDRLITEVIWAGSTGKVLIRETNRESDVLRVILVDAKQNSAKVVREVDVNAIDGGWLEVSQDTRYIPADPQNGRPQDGYIDTIIHEGYDHLGYFTPLDAPHPILLTAGEWEVVSAPSAIDLKKNIVYFQSTQHSSIERRVYSVKLDGQDLQVLPETSKEGYYYASFSKGAGYMLLSYQGPNIPWQSVVSTPSAETPYLHEIEKNRELAALASAHELPLMTYSTIIIDGFPLNVVEWRPPHFNSKNKYAVLFHLYGGPGSQTVEKKWNVDFQPYVAASLGYIVVTVDGRGTGFTGRASRVVIRKNLGAIEAYDQIQTAKFWAKKPYVDADRIAIWGWSYGGFMTLKTLELDRGETFKYGMAVAPVTDWRFYDSIYTERYMLTPQHNTEGYNNASISDVRALSKSERFLIMHGVADDNVHMQNTLTLIDKLDLASVENYDVHFFPDSDHSIYFHNANRMVYDKLNSWLINAFNGEWLRADDPVPIGKRYIRGEWED